MISEHVEKLISFFGDQDTTAEKMKVGQGTVSGWLNRKHGMSGIKAQLAEKLTNGEVKAIDLCPALAELEESTNV